MILLDRREAGRFRAAVRRCVAGRPRGLAPYVVVRRKSDGQKGSLEFQHHPRYYFRFQLDELT